MAGVVINGLPGNPVTAADGTYSATVNYGFDGTATPTLAGYTFVPATRVYTDVAANTTSQDYAATLNTYTISGTVTPATAGVVINGLPGNPVTAADGTYSATVDYGFDGTATPTLAGYTFVPATRVYTDVSANQTAQDYAATLNTYTISGAVAPVLAGVVINGLPGNPVTAADGTYSATVDYGFDGTATPTLAGYTFVPATRVYTDVSANQTAQDYAATLNTYTISGAVAPVLAGVVINGLPGNPVTAADGTYSATVDYGFDGTATPTLAGYTFVPATRVYTDVSANQTAQDYAATLNSYTISGAVTPAMAGVVINGLPGNPVTAADGTYSATANYGFDGTATPTLAGYTFVPATRVYTDVAANMTAQDYAATLNTFTISGTVTPALAGVVINGLPGNPMTAADGTYTATVDYGFDGTATPTLAGYTFVPATRVYTDVAANTTSQDYAATLNTFTISGTVTPALAGVVINGLPGNPVTAADGTYTATVDYGFDGTATPTLAGYTFVPATRVYTDVSANQTAQDYAATLNTFTISGMVTPAIAGVAINGLPGNPVTAADGTYAATVDYGFDGTATPTLAGYTFVPAIRVYADVAANMTAQDYAATINTYTISGTVTPAMAGVVINGLPGNPVTAADGTYAATVDYGFDGTATPTLAGYTFFPASTTYSDVTSNQTAQNYAATILTYTISGTVTPAMAGVVINGLPGNPVTAADGTYSATVNYGFDGTATPTLAGYTFVPATRVYTDVAANMTAQDYAATLNTYTISGTVTPAMAGVVINGLPGNPVTTADGTYSATVNYGFDGTATPTLAGYTFVPATRVYTDVAANMTAQDYAATLNTYTISGTVTPAMAGVVINGLPGNPVTAADGTYAATVDYGFDGTATPTLAGYTFVPATRVYTDVAANTTAQDYAATLNTFTISGTVTPAMAGVVINGLPGNPVTAADGTYAATVDYGFDGTATPTLAGYTFVPATRVYTDVAANTTAQDYAATLNTFTISGTVTPAMAGVVINGLPGNPVTAADGTYSATVNYGFDGTATPTLAGYTFVPATRVYTDVAANMTAQDYAATLNTFTISGTVTPAMAGVVINGLPGNPVTAADGTYSATVNYGFDGTATPTLAGYTFVPATRVYTDVAANMTAQDYAATLNTFTISGTVTPAMAGVVINGLPGNPVTAADGTYSATVDYGFDGTATPTLAGYTFVPATRVYNDVSANHTAQDYTATLNTYTISGAVTPAMAGVVINGLPGNPVTAADGTYAATVNYGFDGTATPTLAGYTFVPATRVYTDVAANMTAQDYAATLNTFTISGTVTPAMAGVVINGLPGNPVTAADGTYSATVNYGFDGTATPTLAGYTFVPATRVYTDVAANTTSQDYAATLNTFTISGTVTPAMAGIVINGLPGNPVTAADGTYSATVDYGFDGTATPTLAGYTFVPATRVYADVNANQTAQDYAATLNSYTISGTVTPAMAGVVINGLPGNPVTAADGTYTATVNYGFDGTATPTLAGYTFVPATRVYSDVAANTTSQDYAATLNTYTISGTVTPAMAGVVINGLPGNPVTAADGTYTATVDYGFDGTATPTLAGYTFVPATTGLR